MKTFLKFGLCAALAALVLGSAYAYMGNPRIIAAGVDVHVDQTNVYVDVPVLLTGRWKWDEPATIDPSKVTSWSVNSANAGFSATSNGAYSISLGYVNPVYFKAMDVGDYLVTLTATGDLGSQSATSQVTAIKIQLAIFDEDGVSFPKKNVPVNRARKYTAKVTPEWPGTYQWSASAGVSLANDDQQTVTVTGGADPSDALDAELLQVEFERDDLGQGPDPATHTVTVYQVTIDPLARVCTKAVHASHNTDVTITPYPLPEPNTITLSDTAKAKLVYGGQVADSIDIYDGVSLAVTGLVDTAVDGVSLTVPYVGYVGDTAGPLTQELFTVVDVASLTGTEQLHANNTRTDTTDADEERAPENTLFACRTDAGDANIDLDLQWAPSEWTTDFRWDAEAHGSGAFSAGGEAALQWTSGTNQFNLTGYFDCNQDQSFDSNEPHRTIPVSIVDLIDFKLTNDCIDHPEKIDSTRSDEDVETLDLMQAKPDSVVQLDMDLGWMPSDALATRMKWQMIPADNWTTEQDVFAADHKAQNTWSAGGDVIGCTREHDVRAWYDCNDNNTYDENEPRRLIKTEIAFFEHVKVTGKGGGVESLLQPGGVGWNKEVEIKKPDDRVIKITQTEEPKLDMIILEAQDSKHTCVKERARICTTCVCSGGNCPPFGSVLFERVDSVHMAINLKDCALWFDVETNDVGNPISYSNFKWPRERETNGVLVSYEWLNAAGHKVTVTNGQITEFSSAYGTVSLAEIENGFQLTCQSTNGIPPIYYTFTNPDADTNVIKVVREVGESFWTNIYEHSTPGGVPTWTLTQGGGLRVETVAGPETNKLRTVKNASNTVCTVTQEKYQNFGWGMAMVENIADPDGAALSSTWTYYTNPAETGRYSRVHLEVRADGSWVSYDYTADGLVSVQVSGFKDVAAGSAANLAKAVYYDYTPRAGEPAILSGSPRSVVETTLGIVDSVNYYSYSTDSQGDIIETNERASSATAEFGSSNNLRTVTVRLGGSDLATQGRTASVLSPDGRLDTYEYLKGAYATNGTPGGGTFTTNSAGTDVQTTLTHGTADHPEGIANKTTQEVTVEDLMGWTLLQETYVYTGSGYERVGWTDYKLDVDGHVTDTYRSDGSHSEANWGCCGKDYEKDGNGMEKYYDYDALNRLTTITKMGIAAGAYPAQADIYTDYAYDADGRQLTQTLAAGPLSQVSSNAFDLAGRQTKSTDSAGLVTETVYANGGRTETQTLPGGATRITERYLDGQVKSVTGSGQIAQYYDFGINADGTKWAKVYSASDNSPVWTKTTSDMLGRTIKVEKPGYSTTEVTENFYNNLNQQVKTTTDGQPDTLYEYDELGNQIRSGLDLNANGSLDLAGTDRISESDTSYTSDSSDWFLQTVSKVYCADASATPTTNSVTRRQLTGLGGSQFLVTVSLDALNNETVTTTTVDRDAKTVTQTTDVPDSASNIVTIAVNGLLQSSTTAHGSLLTYSYDALARQTRSETSGGTRSVASVTHYDSTHGWVDYVEDAASNRTTFTYESATGRRLSQTDAMSNTSYSSYTDYGQLEKTWGSATYPVSYEYDTYGRMATMNTYRGGTGWSGATWPGDPGTADTTTWVYDETSGLLTSKQDAAGKSVTYTYATGGKLSSRQWARMDGTNSLIASYSYSAAGDLTEIDYSDSTPDVSFSYDRLGRQQTAESSISAHTFSYNGLLLDTETIVGGGFTNVIDRSQDGFGRPTGFTVAGVGDPGYSVTYGYDSFGRLSMGSNFAFSAISAVNYSYLPNSDLLSGYTVAGVGDPGLSVSRSYEDYRNLLTQVKNQAGTNLISQFDYSNDAVGRRTQRIDFGGITNTFGYNTRSELIEANMSTNVYGYQYDPIGNRIWAIANVESNDYTANALNQYSVISNASYTSHPSYDFDGNATNNGTWVYAWDGENRLIGATNESTAASYAYDYMSRRSQKVVGSTTNTFLYDGWNLISEIVDTPTLRYTNTYTWGIDLSGSLQGAGGIGGLVSVTRSTSAGTATYYPCYDANGNITDYTDTNGVVVAHREYDAFGNTIVATGEMVNDFHFWFSTKYLDQETGLYYYGYRYYDPVTGRFGSKDPIEEDGGMNLFAFCANNPIIEIDIMGMAHVKNETGSTLLILGNYDLSQKCRDFIIANKILYKSIDATEGIANVMQQLYRGEDSKSYALLIDVDGWWTTPPPGTGGSAMKIRSGHRTLTAGNVTSSFWPFYYNVTTFELQFLKMSPLLNLTDRLVSEWEKAILAGKAACGQCTDDDVVNIRLAIKVTRLAINDFPDAK